MNWLEVTVNTHSESVEVVSSILIELGSKGVSIDDPQDYYQLTDEQLEWLKVQQKDLYETDTVIAFGPLAYLCERSRCGAGEENCGVSHDTRPLRLAPRTPQSAAARRKGF